MCAARMQKSLGRTGWTVAVESDREHGTTIVRAFHSEDADAVMAIVEESPAAAIWLKESYIRFASEGGSLALVIQTRREIRGFLLGRVAADQAELLNLAITTKQRRKGAGTALLAKALEEWRSRGAKSAYLEVRESNTGAIAFYERHGFAKTGLRRGYYRHPDEPAVTMERKLTGSIG
jgi:ribosomal-protein-alanine N-acetyltransferase